MKYKAPKERDIQTGEHLFPPDQERFTTAEAAQYLGYKTKTGLTYHLYTPDLKPEERLIAPDETYRSGGKVVMLIFYRKTLDRFIELRRKSIRPGPPIDLKID